MISSIESGSSPSLSILLEQRVDACPRPKSRNCEGSVDSGGGLAFGKNRKRCAIAQGPAP